MRIMHEEWSQAQAEQATLEVIDAVIGQLYQIIYGKRNGTVKPFGIPGKKFKCGVPILIKNNTNIKIVQTNQDMQGRILHAIIRENSTCYYRMKVVNIT